MVYLALPGNFGYCHESVIGNSFKGSLKISFSFLLGEYCRVFCFLVNIAWWILPYLLHCISIRCTENFKIWHRLFWIHSFYHKESQVLIGHCHIWALHCLIWQTSLADSLEKAFILHFIPDNFEMKHITISAPYAECTGCFL